MEAHLVKIVGLVVPEAQAALEAHLVLLAVVVVLEQELDVLDQLVPTARRLALQALAEQVAEVHQPQQLVGAVVAREAAQPVRHVVQQLGRVHAAVAQQVCPTRHPSLDWRYERGCVCRQTYVVVLAQQRLLPRPGVLGPVRQLGLLGQRLHAALDPGQRLACAVGPSVTPKSRLALHLPGVCMFQAKP